MLELRLAVSQLFLRKFDNLLLLNISITSLEQVEELNGSIQATNINFRSIIRRVELLKTNLNTLRNNERYKALWDETSVEAEKYNLDQPIVPRNRRLPKRLDSNSHTAHFPSTVEDRYRPIFFGVLDQLIASFNSRFD